MLQLSKLSGTASLNGPLIAPLASWDNFKPASFLLTLKGAPEILLPHCSYVLDPQGGPPIPLTRYEIDRVSAVQETWSRQGQRVILLARRVIHDEFFEKASAFQSEEFSSVLDEYTSDLIIVGLVGLIDPLKPDIKNTVQYVFLGPILIPVRRPYLTPPCRVCRNAGIRFFIVTGKT